MRVYAVRTAAAPFELFDRKNGNEPPPLPAADDGIACVGRLPQGFVDLWCMQAAATLSFMGDMEQALKDLSLALPFHLIEVSVLAPLSLPIKPFTIAPTLRVKNYSELLWDNFCGSEKVESCVCGGFHVIVRFL